MVAREDHQGSLAAFPDLHDDGFYSFVHPVALAGQLFLQRQDSLHPAQVDNDIALLETADRSGDDILNAIKIIAIDELPLRLPDPLDDHLLGRLSCNPAELLWGNLHFNKITDLAAGIINPRFIELHLLVGQLDLFDNLQLRKHFDRARFPVDIYLDIPGGLKIPLVSRDQSYLQRFKKYFQLDPFLFFNRFQSGNEFLAVH